MQKLGKLPVLRALLALNHIALLLPFVFCLTIFYGLILYPWLFWWVAIIFSRGILYVGGTTGCHRFWVDKTPLGHFTFIVPPLLEKNPKTRVGEKYRYALSLKS